MRLARLKLKKKKYNINDVELDEFFLIEKMFMHAQQAQQGGRAKWNKLVDLASSCCSSEVICGKTKCEHFK